MRAVYKKEIRGFFTSMTGYVFIAFLLAFTGIYFTAYQLQGMYPNFSYTLQSILIAFLILVPVLTMRTLAEERRQKTDQLLLTSPVSVSRIVLGKYLALISVYAVPVLVLAFYPLIISQFGTVAFPETYCALLGFFLLGAAYLAVGLFISSLTESQVIAAVLTFFALFLSYVMQGIASFFPETAEGSFYALVIIGIVLAYIVYRMIGKAVLSAIVLVIVEAALTGLYMTNPSVYEGLIQKILNVFAVTEHFSEFAQGMLDVAGIIYYLSVIALFLFLTVQSIEKRRWGTDHGSLKNGSYSMALTAILTAAVIAVNLIVGEVPSAYTQIDMTDQKLTVLSDQTKDIISDLDKDVTIYYIVQENNYDENIRRLLERYDELSSHITVEEKDPVRYPKFAEQYTGSRLSENSLIVTCGDMSRVVNYNDMYEYEMDYNTYSYNTTGFDAEGQITSAIAGVSSDDIPKLYTLTGHGEISLDAGYTSAIEKENIMTEELNLITGTSVPDDADCVLVLSPTEDLSKAEADKLLAYLLTGGCAIIVSDYTGKEMPNLDSVMEYYGIEKTDGVVFEGDSGNYVQVPYYLVPTINNTAVSSDLSGGNAYVLMAAAQGLTTSEDKRSAVTISEVLKTSDSSYSKTNVTNMKTYSKEKEDADGPFAIGMIAEEKVSLTKEVRDEAENLIKNASEGASIVSGNLGSMLKLDDEADRAEETDENTTDTEKTVDTDKTADTEKTDRETVDAAENEAAEAAGAAEAEKTESRATEAAEAETTESRATEAAGAAESKTAETEAAEEVGAVETETSDAENSREVDSEEPDAGDEAEAEEVTTKLAVYTSSTIADSSLNQMVSGGNQKLFINTLSWMCGHEMSISIPSKSMTVSYLNITAANSNFWSIMVIGVIPGIFLIYGFIVWMRRRQK